MKIHYLKKRRYKVSGKMRLITLCNKIVSPRIHHSLHRDIINCKLCKEKELAKKVHSCECCAMDTKTEIRSNGKFICGWCYHARNFRDRL